MATEIVNKTPGIVTLPTSLSGQLLASGAGAVLNLTESAVLTEFGGSVPQGLVIRTVPDGQTFTSDLPWVP